MKKPIINIIVKQELPVFRVKDKYNNPKIQAYTDYLNSLPWDYFVTGSTGYILSLQAARRLAMRFHNMLPSNSRTFFVSEKFECRDGYHIHMLVWIEKSKLSPRSIHYGDPDFDRPWEDYSIRRLSEIWQIVTGNKDKSKPYIDITGGEIVPHGLPERFSSGNMEGVWVKQDRKARRDAL